mmetsp:Transcript_9447/g.10946  ORF Transcript_9447/g.10946 Transcript_9447/m.10946 type:complete len:159 (-) Transcript_9447:199-675(-)|eukprot:CAMPEP_0197847078 /NCGR_PEP_ID=MMETSP1438-20131217/5189_1 /TAXON_ID=1461541 /ORGANISM="Pterosperma sp., Strain CCMP1384" /LENGTH=158 /DNA_ID=CAMNT_0043458895 /DNA_START=95 /DNA_END=571 /DNA_ORIENTATION=+
MGKKSKEAKEPKEDKEDKEEVNPAKLCPIAKPLANSKLSSKLLKVVKKASKRKQVKRGVKEVVKALRRDTKGVCVIAGDISPIDVIAHLPVLCEGANVPYIFVPSKEELGNSSQSKRPTSCMLILDKPGKGASTDDDEGFDELYEGVVSKVKSAQVVY